MKELAAAQEALENTQSSTVEKMALYGKFEEMSRETNHVLVQAVRELKRNENEDKQSVCSSRSSRSVATSKSKHSKSTRSSLASSSSSARLRRLELEEEIATLRIKMNLAHEKEGLDKASKSAMEEIEKRKLELQMEEQQIMDEIETSRERFRLKELLAEKVARVEACVRFENESMPVLDDGDQENATQEHIERFLQSQAEPPIPPTVTNDDNKPTSPSFPKATPETGSRQHDLSDTPQFNPSAPVYIPLASTTAYPPSAQPNNGIPSTNAELVQVQLTAIAKLLEIQNQNRLPLPEPGVFTGKPLQYPTWIKAFETLIEGKAINSVERLHLLSKYVSGEAKEVVNGFMLLDGEDAYLKARNS